MIIWGSRLFFLASTRLLRAVTAAVSMRFVLVSCTKVDDLVVLSFASAIGLIALASTSWSGVLARYSMVFRVSKTPSAQALRVGKSKLMNQTETCFRDSKVDPSFFAHSRSSRSKNATFSLRLLEYPGSWSYQCSMTMRY